MKKNMGTFDKGIRVLVAILFIGLYAAKAVTGALAVFLLVLTTYLVLTSLVSFCPIYYPFGISTRGSGSDLDDNLTHHDELLGQ
jgi:hypothetical protein